MLSKTGTQKCGLFYGIHEYKDKQHSNFVEFIENSTRKKLYLNNVSVQEIGVLSTKELNNVLVESKFHVTGYIRIDLEAKTVYKYQNFSDTAKIIDSYRLVDTMPLGNGWSFYMQNTVVNSKEYYYLPDTTINSIKYKRTVSTQYSSKDSAEIDYILTSYFTYDNRRDFTFCFDRAFSKIIGLPMVRNEAYYPKFDFIVKSEIQFVRDYLTKEELRIFKAWEKNAKKHPVL